MKTIAPPKTAYILLWFPFSSETFVFKEVQRLREIGLPIYVYTLYASALAHCSDEMRGYNGPLRHLGARAAINILWAFFQELAQRPLFVLKLMREAIFRPMRDIETRAENLWCFFAAFALAKMCREDQIELLHSPWANGPGTAAWIASRLTDIPFAITGRAGDIYPPDGLLEEKLRDCLFVRTNTATNTRYLASFLPEAQREKISLVYNGLTLPQAKATKIEFAPPFKLLAIGRFAPTKGFDILLTAMARLRREAFPCSLTLVGDGWMHWHIKAQIKRLKLGDMVEMPGFISHDKIIELFNSHHMLVAPCVVATSGDRDGIPNVILEALSCALPVIATDVSGIAEVVQNGHTGLLIPERDSVALAEAIKNMALSADEAKIMAENGKKLVNTMFDPKNNTQKLHDLYVNYYAKSQKAQ